MSDGSPQNGSTPGVTPSPLELAKDAILRLRMAGQSAAEGAVQDLVTAHEALLERHQALHGQHQALLAKQVAPKALVAHFPEAPAKAKEKHP